MRLFSWNVRGLNDPLKQAEVLRIARDLQLDICCFVETRVKEVNKI